MGPGSARRIVIICAIASASAGCSPLLQSLSRPRQSPASDLRAQRQTRPYDLMPADEQAAAASRRPTAQDRTRLASPDDQWVAFESDRATPGVYVASRDGDVSQRLGALRVTRLAAWSPDSSRLAFLERSARANAGWQIWLFDVRDGRTSRVAAPVSEMTSDVRWFPDGRRLCFGRAGDLVVVDTAGGTVISVPLPGNGVIVGSPAVSPDGGFVAFVVAGDGAWLTSMASGTTRRIVSGDGVEQLAWAPSGRQLAYRRDGRWQVQAIE